jgi:hypothetical protein
LFIAWKDNVLVLFITTIAGQLEMVDKIRKRPSETLISTKITRKPFGDKPRKLLFVLVFDNKYNNKINPVDQGNQLKAEYSMQKSYRIRKYHSLIT